MSSSHPGCHIGQGRIWLHFWFREPSERYRRTGRVIIQNGSSRSAAGTTIDRGSLRDTMIGEGTKIDNQVSDRPTMWTIGRAFAWWPAQCGLAGSLTPRGQCRAWAPKVGYQQTMFTIGRWRPR